MSTHILTPNTSEALSEAALFILLSLAGEPKHGYAIIKETAALSGGRVELGAGTLYGAVKRMVDSGWIERLNEDGSQADGRERKVYRLTGKGSAILKAEMERMRAVLEIARRRELEDFA
jgi:DNA-binding PadR family transcriptional regulator